MNAGYFLCVVILLKYLLVSRPERDKFGANSYIRSQVTGERTYPQFEFYVYD
jgi:hypothetical protein